MDKNTTSEFIKTIIDLSQTTEVMIYSDMDGVLAEYGSGEKSLILENHPHFFLNKRPIFSTINKLKQLSQFANIEIGIMSNCYFAEQREEKKLWLKKYCPFIKEENINIIVYSEESYTQETKDQLKIFKLMHINKNKHTPYFLIEDTHKIINATNKILPNVAHHFSEILD